MGANVKLPPYADPVERMKSIGSSDIGVILGVSKFMSRCELWAQKRGTRPPQPETMAMRMGKKLEPVAAEIYTEDTGIKLRRRNITQRLPGYDWVTSHVDRMAVGFQKIVEIKCPGHWGAKEFGDVGTDDIPQQYLAQVQWQMGICGVPQADVGVLAGGHSFSIYPVEYDAEIFGWLLEQATEFWQMVKEGNPPEPESESDCKALWPLATRSVVVANKGFCVGEVYHNSKEVLKLAKFQFTTAMGDFEELHDENGNTLATYKNSTSNRFDQTAFKQDHPELHKKYTKQSTSRRLLIKEARNEDQS